MFVNLICKTLIFKWRLKRALLIFSIMMVILLPGVAIASGYMGLTIVGVVPGPTLPADIINELGGKSISYWFIALSGIAITSWTFFAKWMLKQLEDQRKVNADLVTKLLLYLETDHAAGKAVMIETLDVLKQVRNKLSVREELPARRQEKKAKGG